MIRIYTDGSVSRPREGTSPGGWSFRFQTSDCILHEKFGGNLKTTNNRMELTAAIKALRFFKQCDYGNECCIISDSQYVINGASKFLHAWRMGGLLNNRSRIKNVDLWLQLDEAAKGLKTRWLWVRGHTGNPDNERCDRLAKLGSLRAQDIENALNLRAA